MSQVHVVGLDLAKQVFQVHAITLEGAVIVQLRRSQVLALFSKLPSCLVGMEACGGAHFWAREIATFSHHCGDNRDPSIMPKSCSVAVAQWILGQVRRSGEIKMSDAVGLRAGAYPIWRAIRDDVQRQNSRTTSFSPA